VLRWIKIGCGACFLHEPTGHQMEIGPPVSGDYEQDFPPLLRQALFMHFIDCRIPTRIDTELDPQMTCDLCRKYMVAPSRWCKCAQHKFCQRCIQQWVSMIGNPDIGKFKEKNTESYFNLGESKAFPEWKAHQSTFIENILLPEHCPLYYECKVQDKIDAKNPQIEAIKSADAQGELAMSVYQQLDEENASRKCRLDLLNVHYQAREMELMQKEVDQGAGARLGDLIKQYPEAAHRLAGYK